jgi:hypothetical protein
MMFFNKIFRVVKSIRQLGFLPLVYLGLYRLGLWTGFWRVMTPSWPDKPLAFLLDEDALFSSPSFTHLVQSTLQDFFNRQPDAAAALLEEAEEILVGQVRLFGGPARPLQLVPPGELRHWTTWENGWFPPDTDPDIKLIWEPARFDPGPGVRMSRQTYAGSKKTGGFGEEVVVVLGQGIDPCEGQAAGMLGDRGPQHPDILRGGRGGSRQNAAGEAPGD